MCCSSTYDNIYKKSRQLQCHFVYKDSGRTFVFDGHFFIMKTIQLTQGKFTQVDDEDYDFLNQWKWYAKRSRKTEKFYALRRESDLIENGVKVKFGETICMHRVIMNCPKGMVVDHKDNDGLNNQKYNLRICTDRENLLNRKKIAVGSSKYLGVTLVKGEKNKYKSRRTYWRATCISGKIKKSAQFANTPEGEIMAAKKYDEFAKDLHGEFANLNFK